jgi:hypothetical protein
MNARLGEDNKQGTRTSTMAEPSTLDKDAAVVADATVDATMDNLKIDATTTEITAALSDVSSVQNPRLDIDAVPKKWSPEADRDQRTANDDNKYLPYDAETNFLCGGDFVLNEKGEAATISFLFFGDEGKRYGLTVAHLAPSTGMGSLLFTCTKDSFIRIGRVKQFSHSTDSLIFELEPDIKADFYKVRLADNTKHDIDLSTSVNALKTLLSGKARGDVTLLVGRGAQRRGTNGQYSISTWTYPSTEHILTGDLRMSSIGIDTEGMKEITHERDCGMIVIDKNGEALSMHHACGEAEVDGNIIYKSFSVPLCRIMKVHAAHFPNFVPEEDDDYLIMTSSPQRTS